MPRIPRVVIPGIPHHVVQRGNRRQRVFFGDDDRRFYLWLLKKYAAEAGIAVWAYCLMENHVHLIAMPRDEHSLAMGFKALHWAYAVHINLREGWNGYLWQGRYFSCPLDGSHLLAAMRYVECNPVRAGLVRKAADYHWSSAGAHVLDREDPVIQRCEVQNQIKDWASFLSVPAPDVEIAFLRQNTRTGRPAGNREFVERLEKVTGRSLRERKKGPKKGAASASSQTPLELGLSAGGSEPEYRK